MYNYLTIFRPRWIGSRVLFVRQPTFNGVPGDPQRVVPTPSVRRLGLSPCIATNENRFVYQGI
jgi:hypothetical protein